MTVVTFFSIQVALFFLGTCGPLGGGLFFIHYLLVLKMSLPEGGSFQLGSFFQPWKLWLFWPFQIATRKSLEAIRKSMRAMHQLQLGGQRLFSCMPEEFKKQMFAASNRDCSRRPCLCILLWVSSCNPHQNLSRGPWTDPHDPWAVGWLLRFPACWFSLASP